MEKPLVKKIGENYLYFGGLSLLYGVLFTLFIYDNFSGVTFPVYAGITILFGILFTRAIGFKVQKGSAKYFIAIVLLGISNALTTSTFFILFNWIGIVLLFGVVMIHQFYNESDWGLFGYIKRLFILFGTMVLTSIYPFKHGLSYMSKKETKKRKAVFSIIAGLGIAIGLGIIILPLLFKSDPIFEKVFVDLFQVISIDSLFWICVMIVVGTISCYAFFSSLCTYNFPTTQTIRTKQTMNPIIAITFTSVLGVVYLLYCGIQIMYLFIGTGQMLPKGMTYSEYARSGFWELLFVSVINVIIVVVCMYIFRKNIFLKGILTILSACTGIMVVSATYRMLLYIGEYHLTFLRLFTLWSILVLSLIIVGVVIHIYVKKFPMFKYNMAIVTICYILLSFSKPDYLVAKYNVSQMKAMEVEDVAYMMNSLSKDAAPAIATINPNKVSVNEFQEDNDYYETVEHRMYIYFEDISDDYKNLSFRKINGSKVMAKMAAEDYMKTYKKD